MILNVFREMPVIGIDDGGFKKGVNETSLLVVVLMEKLGIKAVKFEHIHVDGWDATEKAIKALKGLNFKAVMLAGVSFAGFNLIDPAAVFNVFRKPIIVILKRKPDNKAVKRALVRHFKDWKLRWSVFEKLGEVHRLKLPGKRGYLYFEAINAAPELTIQMIKALTFFDDYPEPIRVAHLIAHGLSK